LHSCEIQVKTYKPAGKTVHLIPPQKDNITKSKTPDKASSIFTVKKAISDVITTQRVKEKKRSPLQEQTAL
jgi:hypothetical protein